MKQYKTIHQNKQELEQFYSTEKFQYKEQDYIDNIVYNLDRFTPLSNGNMLEDLDGEYILFSDVLKLFSAQNSAVSLEKQSVYNQIRLLVNTTFNDILLGEEVRKLFL